MKKLVEEAIEITLKMNFKTFATASFTKNLGVLHTKDYLMGMKIGYTLATTNTLYVHRQHGDLLDEIKSILKGSKSS